MSLILLILVNIVCNNTVEKKKYMCMYIPWDRWKRLYMSQLLNLLHIYFIIFGFLSIASLVNCHNLKFPCVLYILYGYIFSIIVIANEWWLIFYCSWLYLLYYANRKTYFSHRIVGFILKSLQWNRNPMSIVEILLHS